MVRTYAEFVAWIVKFGCTVRQARNIAKEVRNGVPFADGICQWYYRSDRKYELV
jgi:hypothetical protein